MSTPEAMQAARRWFDDATLQPLGAGHIHDTYLLRHASGRFVLQRVNEVVFVDGDLVMAQTRRLLACWGQQSRYRTPLLVPAPSGDVSVRVAGSLWRLWEYIEPSIVVDPISSLGQAEAAGFAFAAYQTQLNTMSGPLFHDTIDGFLQLGSYLQHYDEVSASAPADEARLVDEHRGLAERLSQRNSYVHGDCKVNNLLFDEVGQQVQAIIDFDTTMYGHWAWDLGDLVRSVCFTRNSVDVAYFAACLKGFAANQPLCNVVDSVAAPRYVALMLGVRFLTDHLQGDAYFRTEVRGENLERARQQFALFRQFDGLREPLEVAARQVLGQH